MTNSAHCNQSGRVILLLCTLLAVAADTPDTAIRKVRQGLQHYRNNAFEEAETAFAEASEEAPENPVITFDKACAARAAGDVDQARSLFRKAAAAKDPRLSVKSHYNLGCLEADMAREKLGEDPLAAVGEAREEAINLMLTSVRHYRDALRIDAQHKGARHNLELIRLYIKHIQSQWAERDKQKARDEKNLLQFLKMIEDRETEIRATTRFLNDEADSVSKRKAIADLIDAQRTLQEELEPLKQKISQELQAPQQQTAPSSTGQTDPANEQNQQAEKLLHALADEAGKQMIAAADALQSKDFEAAEQSETESLNQLNQVYMVVAPYPSLLQRAIQQQQSMVPQASDETVETDGDSESSGDENDTSDAGELEVGEHEAVAQAEQQSRISDWAQVLPLKAEQALPAMKQQLDAISQTAENAEPEQADGESEEGEAPGDEDQVELTEEQKAAKQQQEQMQEQLKQMEGLVKSMELAVELGPEAEEHSRTAHQKLLSKDVSAAGPEQKETLRILKEIAEPLKQDPPPEQDQQNQDQNQQQDDQQQNQNDKDNQDGDQGQQQPRQEPSDEEDKSKEQQDEKRQDRQSEQKKQQAESVLRQARERERKHREMQKQIQAILGRAIKVDKDW